MDSEGRALLEACLPATEPPVPPVDELVDRARSARSGRVTILAGAASVVAVVVTATVVIGSGADRSAGPPAGSAGPPGVTTPAKSSVAASAPVLPPTSPAPAQDRSCRESNGPDPGASAWARWVRGKLAGKRPQAGPVERTQLCYMDLGYGMVFPPHLMNYAMFTLPLAGTPSGTDSLTAVTDRWDRLPELYRKPCAENFVTENVRCEQRRLPDGSVLMRRDYYDLIIPVDPKAKRDKHAVREVRRIFPDGREISVGLVYDLSPAWKRSFERHALSLDQLTAIVTDPGALRHFPRP